ncbi:MAG: hypothetical protein P4M15_11645 [Alphaproteobacteria bacterium]|nr:hypothetical protein [Alphaproteobacteria bacterium]
MHILKYSAAVLGLIALCGGARAEDGDIIDAATVTPLAGWVEHATGVHMQALPRTIASTEKLQSALAMEGVQKARAAAAYLPGRILISNAVWDPDSIRAQSYLVHELVHHAQLVSRRVYPCGAAKEREAYMLQNEWLKQHGEEPLVTQEWIDNISSCSNANSGDGDGD